MGNIMVNDVCNLQCPYCLTADTKILMADKTLKSISDVKEGDVIMGFSEYKKMHIGRTYEYTEVTATMKRRIASNEAILKITLRNGKTLNITGNHKVLIGDGEWCEARYLKAGESTIQEFLDPCDAGSKVSGHSLVESIEEYNEDIDVYNLETTCHTYVANGLLVHNCFANKYVNGDHRTDITYGNFKKAVDWINKSGDMVGQSLRVALIGGEPLLHHDLESLIEYACMQRRPNQEILVFSNCLELDKYVELFAKNNISVLLNLNSPKAIGEKKFKKTIDNVALARKHGVRISMGVNYYDPAMDTGFILDTVKEFSFTDVRLGLACPNTSEKRAEGPFPYLNALKEPILKLTKELAALGCGAHNDCMKFPSCILSDDSEYIDSLCEKHRVEIDFCTHAKCNPVIDILTDLRIVRCFGVSGDKYAVPMDYFETEMDAISYFETSIDNLGLMIPLEEKCVACYHKVTGKCQGGCLGYKLERIDAHTKAND